MSVHRITAAATIAILVLVVACTVGEEAPRTDAAASPALVTLTATDYAFEAPDTIAAGFTTFRLINHGTQIHMAHAIRLEPGRSAQELIEAYDEAIRTAGPRPAWITRFGGTAAEPNAEGNTTQYLEAGSYVWVCPIEDSSGNAHFTKGMARPFVVRAGGPDAAHQTAPEAGLTIRLLDYSFAVDTPLTAGRHIIRVENTGADSHDVAVLKLEPGKTMQDVQRWLQTGQGPPPVRLAGDVAPIAPRMEAFFEAELTPGDYLLLCFSTAPDGRTHIELGMIQQVRIG